MVPLRRIEARAIRHRAVTRDPVAPQIEEADAKWGILLSRDYSARMKGIVQRVRLAYSEGHG